MNPAIVIACVLCGMIGFSSARMSSQARIKVLEADLATARTVRCTYKVSTEATVVSCPVGEEITIPFVCTDGKSWDTSLPGTPGEIIYMPPKAQP